MNADYRGLYGVWACRELELQALADAGTVPRSPAHVDVQRDELSAVVPMIGALSKFRMVQMREQILALAERADVMHVVLLIDSPGGQTAGTNDLAAAVYELRQRKRVTAYLEDLAASAAYYVASQASEIVANPGGLVGSIGTYSVIIDASQALQRAGVRVIVVRAGAMKGAGVDGVEITEEQIADVQRVVDDLNELFIQAVARGRRMTVDRVREIADGRIHIAADALKLGLIDRIDTLEHVLADGRPKMARAFNVFEQLVDARANEPRPGCTWKSRPPAETAANHVREKYPRLAAERDRFVEQGQDRNFRSDLALSINQRRAEICREQGVNEFAGRELALQENPDVALALQVLGERRDLFPTTY